MADYLVNVCIPIRSITKVEFDNLSLEDANYSGILFIFTKDYNKTVCDKINEWELGKSHRLDNVLDDGMFYVENCDVQTIDSKIELFSEIYYKDTIKKIYVLGDVNKL